MTTTPTTPPEYAWDVPHSLPASLDTMLGYTKESVLEFVCGDYDAARRAGDVVEVLVAAWTDGWLAALEDRRPGLPGAPDYVSEVLLEICVPFSLTNSKEDRAADEANPDLPLGELERIARQLEQLRDWVLKCQSLHRAEMAAQRQVVTP